MGGRVDVAHTTTGEPEEPEMSYRPEAGFPPQRVRIASDAAEKAMSPPWPYPSETW